MHCLLKHPMSMMNVSIILSSVYIEDPVKNTAVMLLNLIIQESNTESLRVSHQKCKCKAQRQAQAGGLSETGPNLERLQDNVSRAN